MNISKGPQLRKDCYSWLEAPNISRLNFMNHATTDLSTRTRSNPSLRLQNWLHVLYPTIVPIRCMDQKVFCGGFWSFPKIRGLVIYRPQKGRASRRHRPKRAPQSMETAILGHLVVLLMSCFQPGRLFGLFSCGVALLWPSRALQDLRAKASGDAKGILGF